MTDEFDRPDAAADGSETSDGDTEGGRGKTAVATRPGDQPQRPTGKRSRHRGMAGGDDGDGIDVVSTATELSESDADVEAEKAVKAKKAKKKAEGPSRNPFTFVFNYLKQVVAELRKVIWPNRKQMVTYTSVVLAFLVFMMALVSGSDYGFAKLVLLVFGE